MATRMTSPLAGIGWLRNAINVGGRSPRTLFVAAFLLLLTVFVPSLITTPFQYAFPGDMTVFIGTMVFSMLVGLLLSPVFAGFLQVIDAIERGREVRARDIFAPYRNGVAKPSILFSLLMIPLYVVAVVLVVLSAGPGLWGAFSESWGTAGMQPTMHMPEVPWRVWLVGGLVGLVLSGLWAIGYGQIAIARRSVTEAFVDGISGAIKNLLPFFLLALLMVVCMLATGVAMVLVVALLSLIGKVVGTWLMIVLIVPVYIAFILAVYIVMFALAYFLWRDVCAGDADSAADPQVAVAEV
jgi:hypothetical protein